MKTQKRGKFNLGSKSENTNREASLKQQLAGIIVLEKFKDKIILRNLLSILLGIFILGLIAAPSLILIYNSNSFGDTIFFNSTRNSSLGISLTMNSSAFYNVSSGDYISLIFYNTTSIYWNTTLGFDNGTGFADNYFFCKSVSACQSYWSFDSLLGTATYNDKDGSNTITNSGTTSMSNIAQVSPGILFDSTGNDYLTIPRISSTAFTWSFWLNSTVAGGHLISNSTAGTGVGRLYFNGANLGVTFDTGAPNIEQNAGLATNNWKHIVATYNGSNFSVYNNGILQYSNSSQTGKSLTINALGIQRGATTGIGNFTGELDEVMYFNSALTSSQVTNLYNMGIRRAADANITLQTRVASNYNITDRNLVGLWGLNGNGNDELGKNNCTISATLNLNGTVGQAYSFDGNDDSVNCTDASFYNGISNISYSFWVKRNNQGTVITRGSPHNDAGVIIYTGGATIRFYANSAGGGSNYGQFDIGIGNITNFTWTHIAISVNLGNENGTFWINGVNFSGAKSEFGTGLPSSIGDTSDLTFFGNRPNLADDYNGSIDEIRIYNRTLTQAEVLDLYNLGASHINWSNNGDWSSEQTCYDDKTQILTENGWKLFSELDKTEKVATLNPKTNKIEYHLPSEYQIYDSPEFMYKIQTASGELVVSPEHKLYSKIESKKIPGVIIGILLVVLGIVELMLNLKKWRSQINRR